jgi:hypothetical protein
MSQAISLIKYNYKNEKLLEDDLQIIESAFINDELLKIISDSIGTAKIYEEADSNNFYDIDCIGDVEINIKKLEKKFIKLLKEENTKKNVMVTDSITAFRILTNIYNIFWLKDNKFSEDHSTIIKLG